MHIRDSDGTDNSRISYSLSLVNILNHCISDIVQFVTLKIKSDTGSHRSWLKQQG